MGIRKTNDVKPRRILVKFNSVWAKKDICRNKKIPNDKKIYISEYLTKEAAEIHYHARQRDN